MSKEYNCIPHASQAFTHHSIAALVVPGNPATLEAYVANDQQGANVISEYLYQGSGWGVYTIPLAGGHIPDQVNARTVGITFGSTPITQIIASDPAAQSCTGSAPPAVQYLYQPQLPNPAWHATVVASPGVTDLAAIVTQYGQVFTEAFMGKYRASATIGTAGGGGCFGAINEAFSTLSATIPSRGAMAWSLHWTP